MGVSLLPMVTNMHTALRLLTANLPLMVLRLVVRSPTKALTAIRKKALRLNMTRILQQGMLLMHTDRQILTVHLRPLTVHLLRILTVHPLQILMVHLLQILTVHPLDFSDHLHPMDLPSTDHRIHMDLATSLKDIPKTLLGTMRPEAIRTEVQPIPILAALGRPLRVVRMLNGRN